MAATLIDGKQIAAEIQEELRAEAAALGAVGVTPRLAVILVGEDPGSQIYVRSKRRVAESLGIDAPDFLLPASTPEPELVRLVEELNANPEVHGILVQTPLPGHVDARRVLGAVSPEKDVDGLHPLNLGRLLKGEPGPLPCTPAGVMELLRRSGIDLEGKEAVVVGRSDLVGKPVALLLLRENATVTLCHSRTRDLPAVCRRAEVLIVAMGRARKVTAEYVRPGAAVIDVGISRVDGRVVGDVDADSVRPVAGVLSPVPGGVGPMTITMLMKNTLAAARAAAGQG